MTAAIEGGMQPRHKKSPLPRLWLFTDERVEDEALLGAIDSLPRGSGIVFRHYALAPDHRRALADRITRVARRRRLVLLIAGEAAGLRQTRSGGRHRPARVIRRGHAPGTGLLSASAHDLPGLIAAQHAGADLAFLSPVFATRSHPGARALGPVHFGMLARKAKLPVIALGGMNEKRFRRLWPLGAYGWAAIDALMRTGE